MTLMLQYKSDIRIRQISKQRSEKMNFPDFKHLSPKKPNIIIHVKDKDEDQHILLM